MSDQYPKDKAYSENAEDLFEEEFDSESGIRLTGLMKKVLIGGISTMFVTQEKAREVLKDLKVPKDLLEGLLSNASRTKEDLLNLVGNEVTKILDRIDIAEEGRKFLAQHKIKLSAEINFEKKKCEE